MPVAEQPPYTTADRADLLSPLPGTSPRSQCPRTTFVVLTGSHLVTAIRIYEHEGSGLLGDGNAGCALRPMDGEVGPW